MLHLGGIAFPAVAFPRQLGRNAKKCLGRKRRLCAGGTCQRGPNIRVRGTFGLFSGLAAIRGRSWHWSRNHLRGKGTFFTYNRWHRFISLLSHKGCLCAHPCRTRVTRGHAETLAHTMFSRLKRYAEQQRFCGVRHAWFVRMACL